MSDTVTMKHDFLLMFHRKSRGLSNVTSLTDSQWPDGYFNCFKDLKSSYFGKQEQVSARKYVYMNQKADVEYNINWSIKTEGLQKVTGRRVCHKTGNIWETVTQTHRWYRKTTWLSKTAFLVWEVQDQVLGSLLEFA